MIANDAELEGQTGSFRIAQRRGNAGIGHGDDHIGGSGRFVRQLLPMCFLTS
jgi:hypothetical protein